MKPVPNKAQLRAELEQQMQQYLQQGGQVNDVPRGTSGQIGNHNPFSQRGESAPAQSRTPVDEAVQALEARKNAKSNSANKHRRPKKKLLKDDFGEPLRWVWTDE